MAKKSSESPQPVKLVRKTLEDIANKKWTEEELAALHLIADRQAAGDDSQINYDDIPELTDEQWASAIRFRDRPRKKLVSVRLDEDILEWLRSKGQGHLTRINGILANVMAAERHNVSQQKQA